MMQTRRAGDRKQNKWIGYLASTCRHERQEDKKWAFSIPLLKQKLSFLEQDQDKKFAEQIIRLRSWVFETSECGEHPSLRIPKAV